MPDSVPSSTFSLRSLFLAVAVIAMCLAVAGYFVRRVTDRLADDRRHARLNSAALSTIVKNVEAIRSQLGRAPKDVVEVERLLGKPMPVVYDTGTRTPVNYYRTGKNSFVLRYTLWESDDWIYNSKDPTAGWVQQFY